MHHFVLVGLLIILLFHVFFFIPGGEPSLSNITAVHITVDDINDLEPWFLFTPYTAVIKENENGSLLKVLV